MDLYNIDLKNRKLSKVKPRPISSEGFTEPKDLENWIASVEEQIFSRSILWTMRQDVPSNEQRSDLIGITEKGSAVICELKRGMCEASALTQALGYAAEYAEYDVDDFANAFLAHSKKGHLITKIAESFEEAKEIINTHMASGVIGTEVKINEEQIVILVGEDFSPQLLAIANYLHSSIEQSKFLLECWQYQLYSSGSDDYKISINQILPPPNIRQSIAEKREETRSKKFARDPKRMKFIKEIIAKSAESDSLTAHRNTGASYNCYIAPKAKLDNDYFLDVTAEYPRIWIPESVPAEKYEGLPGVTITKESSGNIIEMENYKSGELILSDQVFNDIVSIIEKGTEG